MTSEQPIAETVPYGSAYGVDHLLAQERLRIAAVVALDQAILAFGEFYEHWHINDMLVDHVDPRSAAYLARVAEGEGDAAWVYDALPEIYRERYKSFDFLKRWIATLAVIGWKLAQPEPSMLNSVAEELALHVILVDAIDGVDYAESASDDDKEGARRSLRQVYETAYEDNDFLGLYELDDSDEIQDIDPHGWAGVGDLRFKEWFTPFRGTGAPHPLVQDSEAER